MNCVELQQSLADVEDGSTPEQSIHLRTCPACSELLEELKSIVATASELQASDEPSPRVWNSIEIALRQEGLIRPQPVGRPIRPGTLCRPLGLGAMAGTGGCASASYRGNPRTAAIPTSSGQVSKPRW